VEESLTSTFSTFHLNEETDIQLFSFFFGQNLDIFCVKECKAF